MKRYQTTTLLFRRQKLKISAWRKYQTAKVIYFTLLCASCYVRLIPRMSMKRLPQFWECGGVQFTAKGKIILFEGWKNIEQLLKDIFIRTQTAPKMYFVLQRRETVTVSSEVKEGYTLTAESVYGGHSIIINGNGRSRRNNGRSGTQGLWERRRQERQL